MPRTSNSIYACVIRFLLSQKHIRQTRTDRTLQDGEEPSKNQVSKNSFSNKHARTLFIHLWKVIMSLLYDNGDGGDSPNDLLCMY